MPYATIREYEIEYSSAQLPDSAHWAAIVAIYSASSNPMHRNCIFPAQRVSIDTVFSNAVEAEEEAHKVAILMIEQGTHHGCTG